MLSAACHHNKGALPAALQLLLFFAHRLIACHLMGANMVIMDAPKFEPSHEDYTADTAEVATWLVNTAIGNAYPKVISRVDASSIQKSNWRRNRKSSSEKHYVIKLRDFLPLAKHHVGIRPPIAIPNRILEALRRVIDERTKANKHYSSLDNRDKKKDQGHIHVIKIMQSILGMLLQINQPRQSAVEPTQDDWEGSYPQNLPSTTEDRRVEAVRSLVDNVSITDAAESSFQPPATSHESISEPTTDDEIYHLEVTDEEIDALYAADSLITSISGAVDEVHELWEECKKGTIDFIMAANCTNALIGSVRKMVHEILVHSSYFKSEEDIKQMAHSTKFAAMIQEGKIEDKFSIPKRRSNEYCELHQWVFRHIEATLKTDFISQLNQEGPDCIPAYRLVENSDYDPKVDRSTMSLHEREIEDRELLHNLVPLICQLNGMPDTPAKDEFTRVLDEVMTTKQTPVWTLFATQCFLEAHHVLRENASQPFSDLKTTGVAIRNAAPRHLKRCRSVLEEPWSERHGLFYQDVVMELERWLVRDNFTAKMSHKAQARAMSHVPPPHLYLEQNLLLAGTMGLTFLVIAQRGCTMEAHRFPSILASAHIYNAAKQEGLCPPDWPAMELLLENYRAEDVFVEERPSNSKTYGPVYAGFRTGSEVTAFKLSKASLIANILMPRGFVSGTEPFTVKIEDAEELLNELYVRTNVTSFTKDGPEQGKVIICERAVAKADPALKYSIYYGSLGPFELSKAFRMSLQKEQYLLKFDHHVFQAHCGKLIGKLYASLRDMLPQDVYGRFIPAVVPVTKMVVVLLTEAGRHDQRRGHLGEKSSYPPLKKAGEIVKDFVETEGQAYGQGLYELGQEPINTKKKMWKGLFKIIEDNERHGASGGGF